MDYPADWEVKKLGEEYQIIMGQSPSSSSYNYDKNGLPLIQGNADIKNGITFTERYTSRPTKICEANTTILSVRAPVGTVSKSDRKTCLGRGVCAVVGKISNFIYYLMKYNEKSWKKLEQGSTFTAVSGKVINDFEIFIPKNEAEQKAIADTLETFDAHIKNLSELIEKKRAIRDGALEDLMSGRTRLKGFSGEWEVMKVKNLVTVIPPSLKVKNRNYLTFGHYPVIDQGQNFISGYTNENSVFPRGEYVIFGEHTCIVKYVDFAFAQGADGIKV